MVDNGSHLTFDFIGLNKIVYSPFKMIRNQSTIPLTYHRNRANLHLAACRHLSLLSTGCFIRPA